MVKFIVTIKDSCETRKTTAVVRKPLPKISRSTPAVRTLYASNKALYLHIYYVANNKYVVCSIESCYHSQQTDLEGYNYMPTLKF